MEEEPVFRQKTFTPVEEESVSKMKYSPSVVEKEEEFVAEKKHVRAEPLPPKRKSFAPPPEEKEEDVEVIIPQGSSQRSSGLFKAVDAPAPPREGSRGGSNFSSSVSEWLISLDLQQYVQTFQEVK